MNKWKKVGLTALAASLVSTLMAGELSVSGAAKDYVQFRCWRHRRKPVCTLLKH